MYKITLQNYIKKLNYGFTAQVLKIFRIPGPIYSSFMYGMISMFKKLKEKILDMARQGQPQICSHISTCTLNLKAFNSLRFPL